MIKLADKTDIKALKDFALTISWAFPLFFCLILPWLFSYAWQWWPLVISVILMTLYAVKPSGLYYPYKFWMTVAGWLGWFNTRIILGITFYGMMWPIGWLLRLTNKLQYKTKLSNDSSYYVKRDEKLEKERLEQPF